MIRQTCNIKSEHVATVRSREVLKKLELKDLNLVLRERERERRLNRMMMINEDVVVVDDDDNNDDEEHDE